MVKKYLYTLVIFLVCTLPIQAQRAMGSWQSYLSYHNATYCQATGNKIYTIANGGLFMYDNEDNSITTYSKENFLNDTDIAAIGYNNSLQTLLILYSNNNIDLLSNDEDVYNLPDYMNKNMTQNKEINSISFADEYAYLATKFGLVKVNMKNKEINNAYILNKNVYSCEIYKGTIYAATEDGLFTGLLTNNLLDVNNWKKVSNSVYNYITVYNDHLLGVIPENGIYDINQNDYSNSQIISGNYLYINKSSDKLIAGNKDQIVIFSDIDSRKYIIHYLNTYNVSYDKGIYWATTGENGLIGLKLDETTNTFSTVVSSIIPNSPKRNFCYNMKFAGDKLLITGGGQIGDRLRRQGTIMTFKDNEWSYFQEDGISEQTHEAYLDITSVAQDPLDEKHHFATSAGEGMYEFYDKKFVKHYSLDNSALESAVEGAKNYVRTNSAIYDNNNNLWILNMSPTNTIKIFTPKKEWMKLHYPEITKLNNLDHLMFDSRGRIWLLATWITDNSFGVFCLDMNGTMTTKDDKHKFVKRFINQDGNTLDHKGFNCIVEDKNGTIWVGSNQGPIVLHNPSYFFEDDYHCTQIKVPRNDGTNLADFLLSNDAIKDIAIDGANRKWMGTETNGLYLLSEDGLETIEHFTVDNSPLPSNNITALAMHPYTGELFIGTDKGIVSYQSNATEAENDFKSDIYAYPNPVTSDYTGLITVTGLVRDSDIKITNVAGDVVFSGTSTGGLFTWDGRDINHKKVASGVYFVLASNAEGKDGIVTKIVITK